jgi:peroxiredoxin
MVHLQKMHEELAGKGLAILGFDCADDPERAEQLLAENAVTFANVLDASEQANRTFFDDYRGSGVPLNYVIDRDGRIAARFYGFAPTDPRVAQALAKVGMR